MHLCTRYNAHWLHSNRAKNQVSIDAFSGTVTVNVAQDHLLQRGGHQHRAPGQEKTRWNKRNINEWTQRTFSEEYISWDSFSSQLKWLRTRQNSMWLNWIYARFIKYFLDVLNINIIEIQIHSSVKIIPKPIFFTIAHEITSNPWQLCLLVCLTKLSVKKETW